MACRSQHVASLVSISIVGGTVECEITECQPLADGRFYLELKGLRRFKVGELTEQDGYRVAIPEVHPASLITLVPLRSLISPSRAFLPGLHCSLKPDPHRFHLVARDHCCLRLHNLIVRSAKGPDCAPPRPHALAAHARKAIVKSSAHQSQGKVLKLSGADLEC